MLSASKEIAQRERVPSPAMAANAAAPLRPHARVTLADALCSTRMSSADVICRWFVIHYDYKTDEVMLMKETYWEKLRS
jgi:hypothetical protein